MDDRSWYEVDVLMADLTSRHHEMIGASEDEIERRIQDYYPNAIVVLMYEKPRTEAGKEEER